MVLIKTLYKNVSQDNSRNFVQYIYYASKIINKWEGYVKFVRYFFNHFGWKFYEAPLKF